MTNLKKNILKNGLASLLRKLVRVLEQLLLVPFFISTWGSAYYGEWVTLTIIPSVIALSDLGLGTAAGNSYVLSYASGDYQKAANINRAGIRAITYTILLLMIISSITILVMDKLHVFDKSLIDTWDAIIAVSILILARLLDFYRQLFTAYYRAARKAALGLNLFALRTLLSLMAGILVLVLGYGVVVFSISQLLVTLLFNLYYAYHGRRILDNYYNYKGVKDISEFKLIINKGFGFLMAPVWQAIYFQGTTFVVRIVLGPEAVAIFNTVRTLSRSINQLYTIVNVSVFPELQFEFGLGNMEKVRKVFRTSVLVVFLLAIVGFLGLFFFGMWFYKIWTHNELAVSNTMWYIFVVGILFNAIWFTAGVVFDARNEPHRFATYGLISSIVSIVVTYVLSQSIGLNGAAIGNVTLDVLMAILVLPSACKLMDMSIKDLFINGFDDLKGLLFNLKKKFVPR